MLTTHPVTFVQDTPSDTWTITHGLHAKPVVSTKVYDNGSLIEILPQSVSFPNDTTVVISFSSPRTGEARLA